MLASIRCAAIVFWQDSILLTCDAGKDPAENKWRLPERDLHADEDMVLCIRRCILEQTGYRANTLHLFRVIHKAGRGKKPPVVTFVFGCQIFPGQLQQPTKRTQMLGPDAIIELASKEAFDDKLLLQLVHDFRAGQPAKQQPII